MSETLAPVLEQHAFIPRARLPEGEARANRMRHPSLAPRRESCRAFRSPTSRISAPPWPPYKKQGLFCWRNPGEAPSGTRSTCRKPARAGMGRDPESVRDGQAAGPPAIFSSCWMTLLEAAAQCAASGRHDGSRALPPWRRSHAVSLTRQEYLQGMKRILNQCWTRLYRLSILPIPAIHRAFRDYSPCHTQN